MNQSLEAEKTSLSLKKKANLKRTAIVGFIGVLLIVVTYLIEFNLVSPDFAKFQGATFFIGLLLLLVGFSNGLSGLSYDEIAFLKILKALELTEKASQDSLILKEAGDRLEKASNILEKFIEKENERVYAYWYSDLVDVEASFIKNLKNRVAPAVRQGKFSFQALENLALAFIDTNTDAMQQLNDSLEEVYEYEESKSPYVNYLSQMTRTTSGLFILSLVGGFTLLFALLWVQSNITNNIFWESLSNPSTVIWGITSSGFVFLFIKKK